MYIHTHTHAHLYSYAYFVNSKAEIEFMLTLVRVKLFVWMCVYERIHILRRVGGNQSVCVMLINTCIQIPYD